MKNIKLFVVFPAALLFLFGLALPSSAPVSAQTSATTDYSTVSTAELQQLIAGLQAQIRALSAGLPSRPAAMSVMGSVDQMGQTSSLKDRIEFKQELKENSQNEDVRKLQQFLSTDKTIYPEGLTTGFFGPRTKEALIKFQNKFKLEANGELNIGTKELINKILEAQGVGKEIPSGLLMTPGLKDRIKVELKNNNGKFEYKIDVKDDDNDDNDGIDLNDDDGDDNDGDSRLEIEVERKHGDVSKVKVDRRDGSFRAKRVFLLSLTDEEDIIKEIAKRLGLSESVVRSVIEFDSDNDDDDSDGDDEDDEDEDDEGDEGDN